MTWSMINVPLNPTNQLNSVAISWVTINVWFVQPALSNVMYA